MINMKCKQLSFMVLEILQSDPCINVLFSFKNRFRGAVVFLCHAPINCTCLNPIPTEAFKDFSPSDKQPEQRHTL